MRLGRVPCTGARVPGVRVCAAALVTLFYLHNIRNLFIYYLRYLSLSQREVIKNAGMYGKVLAIYYYSYFCDKIN